MIELAYLILSSMSTSAKIIIPKVARAQACKFFTDSNNALCCFLCRKLSIGKFKFHCQLHLFQTKRFEMHFRFLLYIWVGVDCRPRSQQICKRTSSNLIRKRAGCDEYVEDQLNVADKNFAKYLFDDTDGKIYLLHEGLI